MDVDALKELDKLIALQRRSNALLETILIKPDATRGMDSVGNSCADLTLIAGELLPMKGAVNECEVLWQVLATAIKDAQTQGLGNTAAKAVDAANAFKAGLAAFNTATKAISE